MGVPLIKMQALEDMLFLVFFKTDKPLSMVEISWGVGKLTKIDPQYRPAISTNLKRTGLDCKLLSIHTDMKKDGLIKRTGFEIWKITNKGREKVQKERKLQ